MKKTVSKHVREDRMERISFIIDAFAGEFGKPIAEAPEGDVIRTLTDKGILIITGITTGTVVTMWIATIAQATRVYRDCHQCDKCPAWVMEICHNNKKLAARQP